MRLLTRVILTITVAVLGGIQAAIFTIPVSYYRAGRNPGDIFGLGDGIAAIFLELEAFTIVFTAVSVLLAIGYRETMAVRLKRTALTLVVSVGTAIAITQPKRGSWAIGLSAAAFFIGMLWTFIGTRKSATG